MPVLITLFNKFWMIELWLNEYTIFMFFGPKNTKIILKFIG